MKKIAVLFSGIGSNLAYILEHLHKKELEVVVALTNRPNAGGIAFAKEYNIPVEIIDSKSFESREIFDEQIVKTLKSYNPDLTVLAGFMRILTTVFTDNIRAINLHPSLLPRHKGIQAIERSYADKFDMGGISVHWVTSELDGGEVILQREVSKVGKSFEEYEDEVKKIEKKALCEGIRKILYYSVQ
ncbi:phosphoribosylglycinamide formyltransferase [Sulfurovum sp. bin170]|uniref:phosphoribosylglycinamide formyltransferase n=1 Tax=Sulfurovum sp. bin170 TaxID=2695268 RepID=UPI0013DF12E3|nr:phosphoribosylglycinamide formyltransferase [Sulfurovum sp. bin170]NEW61000.1 phosphoribosylglycinamide formyltransferase [Sulfurovum sp. bin170]